MQDSSAESVLLVQVRELLGLPSDIAADQLPEPGRTYLNYALSTVTRGELVLDRIRKYRSVKGLRFLDVGCAYGGFLVAAARAGASEVAGFDTDPRLIRIARSYTEAHEIAAVIENGDVTNEGFVRQLGTFDVISCNDVIEHVDDVPQCIANLAGLLGEGGVIHMAIPNRRSPGLIRSDPHFKVFGIVLLERPEAIRYHTILTGIDHYDVGDFFQLDHYLRLFREHGLSVTITNAPVKSAHWVVKELEPDFAALRQENEVFDDERLPEELKAKTRVAVLGIVHLFEKKLADYKSLLASKQSEKATAMSLEIAREFYLETWYAIVERPSQ